MDLTQAGAILKAEREKRNLTVEDVARHLKIGPRQIRALESGDTESVVHPAYAKGFIRSYAAWLGLTQEDLEAREESENGEAQDGQAQSGNGGAKKSHAGLWFFLILALLGGFAYYAWTQNFWNLFAQETEQPETISTTLPTAEEYLAKKEEAANQEPRVETPAPAPVAAPVDVPEAVQQPQAKVQEAEPAPEAASPAQAAGQESAANGGNHKLVITAIEECWVHSNSDKTDTRQFSLRKGDTFALTFVDTLELKLGNAGGVRLRYDGRDMPSPGTSGQVRTIVFPPEE